MLCSRPPCLWFFVFFFTALLAVCPAGCAFADVASASLSATDGDVIAIQGGTYAATPAATISARLTLRCAPFSAIFAPIFLALLFLFLFFFFPRALSLSSLWYCAADAGTKTVGAHARRTFGRAVQHNPPLCHGLPAHTTNWTFIHAQGHGAGHH